MLVDWYTVVLVLPTGTDTVVLLITPVVMGIEKWHLEASPC
jgi:hypothetical protein